MYRDGRDSLILKKPVFDFSVRNQKKSGVCKKLKVSTLDIRIKQSGLKVSHSKVPISELGTWIPIMSISISTLEFYAESAWSPDLGYPKFLCFLIGFVQRNWVFATNSDFLIPISLEPNVIDLRYFKLWIVLVQVI